VAILNRQQQRLENGEAIGGKEKIQVFHSAVGADYFSTVGTPVLRGRAIRLDDTASQPAVAVVNETLAELCWPGQDPLGKRLRVGEDGRLTTVVGVARNGKYRLLSEDALPYVYLSMEQSYQGKMTLLVRAVGNPSALVGPLREQVAALDPDLPADVRRLQDMIRGLAMLPMLLGAFAVGGFALLGLLLATAGLYGVMSHNVTQRTREIGIRMALGAAAPQVARMVLGESLKLTLIGLGFGLVAALPLALAVRSLLVGISPADPAAHLGVLLTLAVVALLATIVPLRRALRVDPLVALRQS